MGYESITFNIVNDKGKISDKKYTCNTEHIGFINSVLGEFVTHKRELTEEQVEILKNTANGNGKNANVIEKSEIGDFFQKVAETDYYDYYDIIQKDGNTFVRIKEKGFLFPNPYAQNIKNDFNLRNGVLLEHNEDLLKRRLNYFNENYDTAKLKPGDEIKIPGTNITLDKSACGWFARNVLSY